MKRTPTGKRLELTERDLVIFELLERYRYLRSTFIHAFVGGASETRFKERLGDLYHEGGYLDRPKEQWQFANARYMPVIYETTEKARRVLSEYGSPDGGHGEAMARGHRQFAHTLMACEVLASIELAAIADPNLRYISSQEILAKAPEATRNSLHPFRIPCHQSGAVTFIVPDGLFGLEYLSDGKKSYRFFALEVDRATMPVTRTNRDQTSYLAKLLAYRQVLAHQTYKAHLGLPNFFVLTATISEQHQQSTMSALQNETGGSTAFLFKVLRQRGALCEMSKPDLSIPRGPWERVGHPPQRIANH